MIIRVSRFLSITVIAITLILPSHALVVNGSQWGGRDKPTSDSTTSLPLTMESINDISLTNDAKNDNVKTADILSLDSIRSTLIRQEETIIFAIIERAQFRQNLILYKKGGFGNLGVPLGSSIPEDGDGNLLSFLEYMLVGTEVLHCGVRRYTSPEEHAFFPDRLPKGPLEALPQLDYPVELLSSEGSASSINFNPILLEKYIEWIVPSISELGDDEQHGSAVLADIAILQALSRRVHYGKFVAESKYRSNPDEYQRLVDVDDADGVMELLTNAIVEEKVLKRSRLKAVTYGREPLLTDIPSTMECGDKASSVASAAASAVVAAFDAIRDEASRKQGKVDPAVIEDIYKKLIIPLTKDIEVAYLFRRCGKEPPSEYASDRMSEDIM